MLHSSIFDYIRKNKGKLKTLNNNTASYIKQLALTYNLTDIELFEVFDELRLFNNKIQYTFKDFENFIKGL